jgi:hypothetical protein
MAKDGLLKVRVPSGDLESWQKRAQEEGMKFPEWVIHELNKLDTREVPSVLVKGVKNVKKFIISRQNEEPVIRVLPTKPSPPVGRVYTGAMKEFNGVPQYEYETENGVRWTAVPPGEE